MAFVKYKVKIERTDQNPVKRKEWLKVADKGNERDGGAIYDYVYSDGFEWDTTEVLTMEIRDENLDMRKIIKAIAGIEP